MIVVTPCSFSIPEMILDTDKAEPIVSKCRAIDVCVCAVCYPFLFHDSLLSLLGGTGPSGPGRRILIFVFLCGSFPERAIVPFLSRLLAFSRSGHFWDILQVVNGLSGFEPGKMNTFDRRPHQS